MPERHGAHPAAIRCREWFAVSSREQASGSGSNSSFRIRATAIVRVLGVGSNELGATPFEGQIEQPTRS